MIEIVLPWPPKVLNPNHKRHWGKKARAAKKYRWDCSLLALASKVETFPDGNIPLHITFFPPDKRHRDADNAVSSCKAAIDGIADALGINDCRFKPQTSDFSAPVKGGKVVMRLG